MKRVLSVTFASVFLVASVGHCSNWVKEFIVENVAIYLDFDSFEKKNNVLYILVKEVNKTTKQIVLQEDDSDEGRLVKIKYYMTRYAFYCDSKKYSMLTVGGYDDEGRFQFGTTEPSEMRSINKDTVLNEIFKEGCDK